MPGESLAIAHASGPVFDAMKISELLSLVRLRHSMRLRPCPVCGSGASRELLRYDRYLLPGRIRECEGCGMIYYGNMLPPQELEAFYVSLYGALMGFEASERQVAVYRDEARFRVQLMSGHLGPLDDVLEIGSGYGYFLDACREAGATRLRGIEPSAAGTRHASCVLGLQDVVVHAPLLGAGNPPFVPRVVALFHVLEHLADPGAALALLSSWLPDGGHLVVEVPDTAGDWSSLGIANFHLSHASYFREETLAALLRRHGFRPGRVDREACGIYPGNLRVFAVRDSAVAAAGPEAPPPSLAGHVARLARHWSLKNGYPRMAARLARSLARR
ncbi:class I SAM-dependent methyltransferase [Acidovorax sacchari]|uniref:class I SAM-dependent methyltransferase n=1 Tax=Acidovorax sacchari TaxID=3230736 RepID=UPI0039E4A437